MNFRCVLILLSIDNGNDILYYIILYYMLIRFIMGKMDADRRWRTEKGHFLSSDGLWHGFLPSTEETSSFFLVRLEWRSVLTLLTPEFTVFSGFVYPRIPRIMILPMTFHCHLGLIPWCLHGDTLAPGERWQRKGPKEVPGTASFAAPKDGMQWLKVKQRRKQWILTGNNSQ